MIAHKTAAAGVSCRGLRTCLPARPAAAGISRRNVVLHYKEDDRLSSEVEQLEKQLNQAGNKPTDPKLSPEQIDEVRYKEPGEKMFFPANSISPESADMKADMGKAADFWDLQVFDGPAPETINGRLSMLAVLIGLVGEWKTGLGLMEQTADHPLTVFGIFLLITFASYVPLARGYTRKEPFSNHLIGFNWTPRAENWNGRIAMLGFAGMVLTEWITGVNTLQAWGLQPVHLPGL